jgi:hypothetical protein
MEFQKRSQEDLLADLTSKLQNLPLKHPDRAILARMIVTLRTELSPHKPQYRGIEEDGAGYANNEEDARLVAETRQRWRVRHKI